MGPGAEALVMGTFEPAGDDLRVVGICFGWPALSTYCGHSKHGL